MPDISDELELELELELEEEEDLDADQTPTEVLHLPDLLELRRASFAADAPTEGGALRWR